MPAPKGHPKYNEAFKTKLYTPQELWDNSVEYFNFCDENPLEKTEQAKFPSRPYKDVNGEMVYPDNLTRIPTKKPYSIEGLCNFLKMSYQTFLNYESKEGYETYFEVCTRIRQIINEQHFEGGMVGYFCSNIVTRKLGLAEKTENKNINEQPLF